MAGGEFCGNAARALIYVLAQDKTYPQSFTMSGTSARITGEAGEQQASFMAQTTLQFECKEFEGQPVPIVHLEGISHAIMTPDHDFFPYLRRTAANQNRAITIINVLEDLEISGKLASSLTFIEPPDNESGPRTTSFVYVPAADTLYPEQACASGSVAAALMFADSHDFAQSPLRIRQPSREFLEVSIAPADGRSEIRVSGSMNIISDGRALGLKYAPEALADTHHPSRTKTPQRHVR
jgi:diaminopimelate epimerase